MPRLVRHGGGFRPAHLQGPTPPPAEGEADLHKGVLFSELVFVCSVEMTVDRSFGSFHFRLFFGS